MFCLALYKRRSEIRQIQFLKKQKQSLEAKTFGNFTLMYENKVVKFSRTKSDELLGYLIYKKGSSVKTKELISVLWGEHADSARYGSSFRNLIVDIKHNLSELQIQNFFITEYNNFRINPEVIKCDYYDFLAGDSAAIKSFAGEFMSQFSWAEEAAGFLEQKALKKN
jgi:two-component SAPR family response regulator